MAAEVRLIEASGGMFEVVADGILVYSKKRTGQFPDEAGLVEKIRGG
jgi:selT/selW/selH-like putative selenoprotein